MSQKLITEMKDACSLQFTVSGDTTEDQVVVIVAEKLIGVSHNDIANGATGTVITKGRFRDIAKANGEVFAIGQRIYWNGTAMTGTASTNPPAGIAVEAQASGDLVCVLDLNF